MDLYENIQTDLRKKECELVKSGCIHAANVDQLFITIRIHCLLFTHLFSLIVADATPAHFPVHFGPEAAEIAHGSYQVWLHILAPVGS